MNKEQIIRSLGGNPDVGLDNLIGEDLTPYSTNLVRARERGFRQWAANPVVFRPMPEQIETMGHVDVTLKPTDYQQAYPSILMMFPGGLHHLISVIDDPYHGRMMLIATNHHLGDGKGNCFMTLSLCGRGRTPTGTGATNQIEDAIRTTSPDLPPDQHNTDAIYRATINLALLLSNHPTHRVKTDRERELQRLAKSPHRAKALDAKAKLRLMPQTIDFVTQPKLYDSHGTQTDITKRPHWRRGHWRNQACGPGWTERRNVFIRPCLIHRDSVDDTTGNVSYLAKH